MSQLSGLFDLPNLINLPKRLLFVIPKQLSYRLFLSELSETLTANGVEVHCACSVDQPTFRESPVRFHHTPLPRGMNPIKHFRTARQLGTLVTEIRPEFIHAHFSSAIFTTALAIKSCWPITIGTFQGLSYPLAKGRLRRLAIKQAETWASSQLHGVWVLTQDDYSQIKRDAPLAKSYLQQTPGFGCCLRYFDPATISSGEQEQLRQSLDIDRNDRVYTFIGRFTEFKGFALTVRSFLELNQRFPKSKLLLIGQFDDLHSSGLNKSQIAQISRHPAIRNVGWQSDVRKYLSITDAVVFPSEREGVPVSLMEAIAMGVPVITLNARGCRNVVTDKVNGLLVYERSKSALMRAMIRIYEDEQLRSLLRKGALATRERFDRQHYINEQLSIYSRLIVT